jgi:hypothetical protein
MNSEFKNFVQKEIKKLHKITLLKEEKKRIEDELQLMAESEKKWMQKAFSKKEGSLHKELGVPEGEKIPVSKMKKALTNPKLRKKAQAAINANPDAYGSLKDEE